MKVAFAAAALAALLAVPADAGDDGRVPHSTLARLGLGSMKVMSDEQGMQVRGMARRSSARSFSMFSISIPAFNSFTGFTDGNSDTQSNSNTSVSASSSVTFSGFSFSNGGISINLGTFTVSGSTSAMAGP